MDKIPKVSFNKKQVENDIDGFELIELNETFFNRKKPLNHNPYALHRPDFYILLFLTEGEVIHKIDFESCKLKSRQCLIISSGQLHAFDAKSDYQGYMVLFNDFFFQRYISVATINEINRLYNNFLGIKKFEIPDSEISFIDDLKFYSNSLKMESKSAALANRLSIYLINLVQNSNNNIDQKISLKNSTLFSEFISYLNSDINKSHDANYFADKLMVSYKHLNKACKAITTLTIKAYIDSYLILEAKRYLTATSLSAKEIGYKLGFDEPTNFSKFFKKHVYETPANFRKNLI